MDERQAFTARLREAMRKAGWERVGAAELARAFNRRYPGLPITLHATRKWLLGEAIPTQARLRVLAEWLNVNPEWLRFGAGTTPTYATREPSPDSGLDFQLMREIAALSIAHQAVVRTLVVALRKSEVPTNAAKGSPSHAGEGATTALASGG